MLIKTIKLVFVLAFIALCVSCSPQLIDQTPGIAAWNAKTYVGQDLFDEFQKMFDAECIGNATQELYDRLQQSRTDSNTIETCSVLEMENGDIWIVSFYDDLKTNKHWKIQSIKVLQGEQALAYRQLLE